MDEPTVSSSHEMGGGDGTTHATSRAFDDLYKRFHARLSRYAFRLLGDAGAAEDVAQEALVRAWHHRDRFTDDAHVAPWLWRVARNLCVDAARARRRVVSLDDVGDQIDHDSDVFSPWESAEEMQHLRDAFDRLNERNREMLYLRDVEGLAYGDVATRLGMSEQGVRQAVVRARRGLRYAFESIVGGSLAAILWLRTRIASRLDHLHQVAAAAAQTVLVAVLSLSATLGAAAAPRAVAASGTPVPSRSETERPAQPVAQADAVPSKDRPLGSTSPLDVGIDRRGHAEVRATVPLGGGRSQQVWAKLWREQRQDPSEILSTTDELGEHACHAADDACERVDGVLADPTGGP